MNNSFIEKTAFDYDLNYETVQHMYNLYWPYRFYEKLEEIISLGETPNKQINSDRQTAAAGY